MHLLHPTDLLKLSFGSNWIKEDISLRDFKDAFLAHFGNFNFAYFEIEESFRIICGKITKRSISLETSTLGI